MVMKMLPFLKRGKRAFILMGWEGKGKVLAIMPVAMEKILQLKQIMTEEVISR